MAERNAASGGGGATSPSLSAYLQAMAAAPEGEDGSVVIEPELSYGFGEFSLRLALHGPHGRYVVPSIGAFSRAVRNLEVIAYGPKLAFVHRAAAFAPGSRPLLRFVQRIAETRWRGAELASGAAAGLGSYGSSPSRGSAARGGAGGLRGRGGALGRSVDLTESETVDFLDAVGDAPFTLKCTDGSARAVQTVSVQAGDPPVQLRLVKDGDGYALVRDEALIGAAAGDTSYVLFDGAFYRTSADFADGADFLREVYRSDDRELYLSAADAAAFGAHVLPRLERAFEVSAPPSLAALRRRPCRLAFYFDKAGETVEVSCRARYGDEEAVLAMAPSEMPAAVERVREGVTVLAGIADAPPGETVGTGTEEQIPHGPDGRGHEDEGEQERRASAASRRARHAGAEDIRAARATLPLALRDLAREQTALDLLHEYFPPSGVLELADEDAAGRLLFEGLARFQALGEVHATAAFDRLLFGRAPRLSIGLSLAGDLIAMDVAATDVPTDELGALLGSYRRRKRFHRMRNGAFVNLEEAEMGPLRRLMDDLGISEGDIASGRVELPTYQAFYLDNELGDVYREDGFEQLVGRYRSLYRAITHGEADLGASSHGALPGILRPYQEAGARWIAALWDAGFGGILADEMGLGKTLQVIAALAERCAASASDRPSLIVCPASLVYNWKAEFDRFAPDLPVEVVAGAPTERRAIRRHAAGFDSGVAAASASGAVAAASSTDIPDMTPAPPILVTSYDLLRRDAKDWEAMELDCAVLDEAQYIKNHATRATRAAKRLRARHRLALTGTPMENRLSELWSILDFLMPGLLGPYQRFREHFEAAIIGGDKDAARRLRTLVAPFVLRRTKQAVAPELPEKAAKCVLVPLEGEQRRLYDGAEQSLRERLAAQIRLSRSRKARKMTDREREAAAPRVQVLAELTALRRIALDPALVFENYTAGSAKTEALLDLIAQGTASGQKMLVYSQFTSYLARLSDHLRKAGIAFYELTGATPSVDRVAMADAFNADDTPVFLISLKAGGTGLNLTGATMVVHTDPWWNAAATRQAADRAHRIGQSRPVAVHELVAAGTIEERMIELARMKDELAALILEASDDSDQNSGLDADAGTVSFDAVSSLSPEELYDLLCP